MKTIEVSDETFEALKAQVRDFGETPESVIRRLLTPTGRSVEVVSHAAMSHEEIKLRELMDSSRFQHMNGKDRYLAILKFLHDDKPDEFSDRLTGLKFGKRIQIAPDPATIERSGKSTYPEVIPDTGYWALSNLSNRSKRDVIFSAMRLLGYGDDLIHYAVRGIPDSNPGRSGNKVMGGRM